MPKRMSFSRIKRFWDCPTDYYISCVANLPMVYSWPLVNGSATHKCIQEILISPDPLNPVFDDKMRESVLSEAKGTGVNIYPDATFKRACLAVKSLYDRIPSLKLVACEEEFNDIVRGTNGADKCWINKVTVKGYIDCIAYGKYKNRGNPIYMMIDWKTAGNVSKASVRYSMRHYRAQLAMYKFYYASKHNIDMDKIRTFFCIVGNDTGIKWKEVKCSKDFVSAIMYEVCESVSVMPVVSLPIFRKDLLKCQYCYSNEVCRKARR